MAETFALTCLGKVGDIVLCTIRDYLVAPIGRHFTYMCCFNSNFRELETQLKELETTRQGVQLAVDDDIRKVRIVGPNVVAWVTSANEVTSEVGGIIQDKPKVEEGCLNGWCPNLKLRYSLSRKAVKKTKAVVDLQAIGVQYTKSSYSPLPACMETIPNRDFRGFESRRLNMEEIRKASTDGGISLIGICGLAGVGKTTMVQEVRTRAKEEKLFDEVAFVAVGQYPDLTKVQNCIADIFGLTDLGKHVDATTRASLLRKRLLQDNTRILLILDDIWVEFDLQHMGIPLAGSNETFKILYTSRFRGVWHDVPTKKEIALGVLLEEEAWQLFRDKAGVLVDAPELKPIAKKIVNECGRLPLALVIIGSTLSKKSCGNFVKDIWEDMLDRLTCTSSNTPMDKRLSSSLELSYNYVDDEEAKRLFLLCCLFEEDKSISIEVLARYALGLSLFDGIKEMSKVRHRVFSLIEDLQSRYLLHDGDEYVKVHDVVRDMGISIASKDKDALVSHSAVSDWPKKDTYEHYTWISLISGKIKELPEGLTCPNLEFFMLECRKLDKLPHNFFARMEKLRVLELNNFVGILTFRFLTNLRTLSLERCLFDNVHLLGGLLNLEILSYRGSSIEKLSEEIGELVNLRLLDLRDTRLLNRIPPRVISRLLHLEELYMVGSKFREWEGEGSEEGRNANLREFESLSKLNTLEISINAGVLIPKLSIFCKLKMYKIVIHDSCMHLYVPSYNKCKKQLWVSTSTRIPSHRGGIDSLLRSCDCLLLEKGCNDLVRELLDEGLQQMKRLDICDCDTPEYLANTVNEVQQPERPTTSATVGFPILEILNLFWLPNLKEICRGPVPAGTFGELTSIRIGHCGRLVNLFQLSIVGYLHQLKTLSLSSCDMMEEVIWKEQREDVKAVTNRIEFPKLETLQLVNLSSLVSFCRGIDEIDFPQLRFLRLEDLGQFNRLFHYSNKRSSNSEQNDNVGFLAVFPQKVTFPSLERLEIIELQNVSDIWGSELTAFSFSKLKQLKVKRCGSLRNMFHPSVAGRLVNLQELVITDCWKLETVVDWEEEVEEGQGRRIDKTLLPQLRELQVQRLPNLRRFCNFTYPLQMPLLSKLYMLDCPNMNAFSSGHVGAPNLSLLGISWNGDLNNAIKLLQETSRK